MRQQQQQQKATSNIINCNFNVININSTQHRRVVVESSNVCRSIGCMCLTTAAE